MTEAEILSLVAALDAALSPNSRLRWRRDSDAEFGAWLPDEDGQQALDRLRAAWRRYQAEHPASES